jgi:rfaE bifunctional protein nucleotidyltransferase chain/domain
MENKKVVYTYGVFDLLHMGHVQLLQEAKALGGKLIVGIFTDEVAEGFKRKPIIAEDQRRDLVAQLKFVDQVLSQDELAPDKNLRELKPDILAKGPGANWEQGQTPPGSEAMNELGGEVVFLNYHDGISTSDIIKKCKES